MKTLISSTALSTAVLLCDGACNSDPDPLGPAWVDGGTHVAEVFDVVLPDTIRASDTLVIQLSAALNRPTGQPEFSRIETHWIENALQMTVWGDVDLWAGAGLMPPTSLVVLWEHTHREPPPFPVGQFEVLISQPDGAPHTDTVYVAVG